MEQAEPQTPPQVGASVLMLVPRLLGVTVKMEMRGAVMGVGVHVPAAQHVPA
jgi:hypothetical protein